MNIKSKNIGISGFIYYESVGEISVITIFNLRVYERIGILVRLFGFTFKISKQ